MGNAGMVTTLPAVSGTVSMEATNLMEEKTGINLGNS
jgi:hypothetical protein